MKRIGIGLVVALAVSLLAVSMAAAQGPYPSYGYSCNPSCGYAPTYNYPQYNCCNTCGGGCASYSYSYSYSNCNTGCYSGCGQSCYGGCGQQQQRTCYSGCGQQQGCCGGFQGSYQGYNPYPAYPSYYPGYNQGYYPGYGQGYYVGW